jgi:hypothetical protein
MSSVYTSQLLRQNGGDTDVFAQVAAACTPVAHALITSTDGTGGRASRPGGETS